MVKILHTSHGIWLLLRHLHSKALPPALEDLRMRWRSVTEISVVAHVIGSQDIKSIIKPHEISSSGWSIQTCWSFWLALAPSIVWTQWHVRFRREISIGAPTSSRNTRL